jgi:hypothetical protein
MPKTTHNAPSPTRHPVQKRSAAQNLRRGPLENFTGHKVMRLLGYWSLVQTYGGWRGVAEQPFWSEGSVQKWRLEFREVFGCEAEDYVPEVGPVLQQAFYGKGNTSKSPEAVQLQSEALVIHQANRAAHKGSGK